ncbi:MAG: hypothetical protein NTW31_08380, partial [Bacteroidetes bacterium]|nr:hypothetical protein [Bacteroidota bacterium]
MYNIDPVFPIGDGKIHPGFESLARRIARENTVIIDGYQGVFFDAARKGLELQFKNAGIDARWQVAGSAMLPSAEIDKLIEPFLGGDDPLFGTRCSLGLQDLFDNEKLKSLKPDPQAEINIIYGAGASLAGWKGCLLYIDLPKNEIQYRARKGLITNLGADRPGNQKSMYKRFYFVDWILLNKHKDELSGRVDVIVD